MPTLRLAPRSLRPTLLILPLLLLMAVTDFSRAYAAEKASAQLTRVAVRPYATHTRLAFYFDTPPEYSVDVMSGGKVVIAFRNAGGALHRRLRSYGDRFVNGIRIAPRGNNLRVVVGTRSDAPTVRELWSPEAGMLSVDVGLATTAGSSNVMPERQPILNGVGKLVKEYDPPFKPIFPFLPTDRRQLVDLISERDAQLFLLGEAALYKGKAAQAEDLFAVFSKRESQVKPLATYRLGESLYILQKYDAALAAFKDAEKLWPEYLSLNPGVAFYYADSIVRSGDFVGGRRSLTRLIASLAERKYAPLLLVRLADTLARQRHEVEAQAIYRSVVTNFPSDKAAGYAALKLADRQIFSVTGDNYTKLLQAYQGLIEKGTDPSLREEALFKAALLESLYGPAAAGLQLVMQYERKYPRGVFTTIARGMREELLPIIFRQLYAAKDLAGIASLAQDHQEYLSRCFGDERFTERLDEAFTSLGQLRKEITLFSTLMGREWAGLQLPFMLLKVMDHSLALADYPLAESSARGFIARFPTNPSVWTVKEKLGKMSFMKNELPTVATELGWLLTGNRPAELPESWYYLGKAVMAAKDSKGAERALSRFISLTKGKAPATPLLVDAYYQLGTIKAGSGDRGAATVLLQTGMDVAGQERRDQFLYKLGEVAIQDGQRDRAKAAWERVVKEGTDPVWQKMASQSLADLEMRDQLQKMSK